MGFEHEHVAYSSFFFLLSSGGDSADLRDTNLTCIALSVVARFFLL